MILKKLTLEWHEAALIIETDLGDIRARGVQTTNLLNSAPWGKSIYCKELRVLRGDDISVLVLFMESRDVITIAAEQIECPVEIGDQYPKPADGDSTPR